MQMYTMHKQIYLPILQVTCKFLRNILEVTEHWDQEQTSNGLIKQE